MVFESQSSKQIVSKQRVADHGEVYTNEREVNAMLDLVKDQTENIEATFLEPACGTGNFLAEILRRKLEVVARKYRKIQFDYERYAILAVAGIYGIDILADNVAACRVRLLDIFRRHYTRHFGKKTNPACLKSAEYILSLNIIHGDALKLTQVVTGQPIEFAQWSAINSRLIKRHDFEFRSLLGVPGDEPLYRTEAFSDITADNGSENRIFHSVRDYPPVHFLKLGDGHD